MLKGPRDASFVPCSEVRSFEQRGHGVTGGDAAAAEVYCRTACGCRGHSSSPSPGTTPSWPVASNAPKHCILAR